MVIYNPATPEDADKIRALVRGQAKGARPVVTSGSEAIKKTALKA
jgi:hypothetical protein